MRREGPRRDVAAHDRDRDLEQRLDRRDGRVPRLARGSPAPDRPPPGEHRPERVRRGVQAHVRAVPARARRRHDRGAAGVGPLAARGLRAPAPDRLPGGQPRQQPARPGFARHARGAGAPLLDRGRERRHAAARACRRRLRHHVAGAQRASRRLPPAARPGVLARGRGLHRRHREARLRGGVPEGRRAAARRRLATTHRRALRSTRTGMRTGSGRSARTPSSAPSTGCRSCAR